MSDISITFEGVRNTAKQVRECNVSLDEKLQEIKRIINELESSYTSDTSDTIRSKINGMQKYFTTYKQVIDSYASFLDRVAEQYEHVESTLNQNAAQFK